MNFSNFVEMKKGNLLEMAQGRSASELKLPITQPMANMISLIPGVAARARALNWFLSEGLLEASIGREKLLKMVNTVIDQRTTPIPMKRNEAQEILNVHGEDPIDPTDVDEFQSNDLFSPEAFQRNPNLNSIKISGMNIDEYYEKYFEPKFMPIEPSPGVYVKVDLDAMRQVLIKNGLEPFYYGGKNGYLQYIEKGDYLPKHEKRSMYSHNGQHDYDMRPQEGPHQNTRGFNSKKSPMINFMGGAVSLDHGNRATNLIHKMKSNFGRVMDLIHQNTSANGLSDEEQVLFNSLSKLKDSFNKEEQLPEKGRGGFATKNLSFPAGRSGAVDFQLQNNDPEYIQNLFGLIDKGLQVPSKAKTNSWKDFSQFGPQWSEGDPEPSDGWYKIVPNGVMFKYNKKQREAIKNHLMNYYQKHGKFLTRINSITIPELQIGGPSKDSRIFTSKLINDGSKSGTSGLTTNNYLLKKNDPSSYTRETNYEKIEVNPLDPHNDPVLSKLFSNGYKYYLNTPKERKAGSPDWNGKGYAILSLRGKDKAEKYRIHYDEASKKFFLFLPQEELGGKYRIPDFSSGGSSWLSSGKELYGGGLGSGHVTANPAGKKTYEQLKKMLLNGKLGESPIDYKGNPESTYNQITELPSILDSIKSAKFKFKGTKGLDRIDRFVEDGELLNWAIEGLQAFSNDPAFQVGYINADEYENILKWDSDRQAQQIDDAEFFGKGQGLIPLFIQNKISNQDRQEEILEKIRSQIGNSPIVNFDGLGSNPLDQSRILNVFGENAFKARVRFITSYILSRMNQKYDMMRKTSMFTGKGGEGTGNEDQDGLSDDSYSNDDVSNIRSQQGEYEDEIQHLQPSQISQMLGLKKQTNPFDNAPAEKPASGNPFSDIKINNVKKQTKKITPMNPFDNIKIKPNTINQNPFDNMQLRKAESVE